MAQTTDVDRHGLKFNNIRGESVVAKRRTCIRSLYSITERNVNEKFHGAYCPWTEA